MKTKISLFLIGTAIITLSFVPETMTQKRQTKIKNKITNQDIKEPIGGFISEEKM